MLKMKKAPLGMAMLLLSMKVVPHTRTNEEMFSLLHILQYI